MFNKTILHNLYIIVLKSIFNKVLWILIQNVLGENLLNLFNKLDLLTKLRQILSTLMSSFQIKLASIYAKNHFMR